MNDHNTSRARDLTGIQRHAGVGHQSMGSCAKCEARTQVRYVRGPFKLRYCAACTGEIDQRAAQRGSV